MHCTFYFFGKEKRSPKCDKLLKQNIMHFFETEEHLFMNLLKELLYQNKSNRFFFLSFHPSSIPPWLGNKRKMAKSLVDYFIQRSSYPSIQVQPLNLIVTGQIWKEDAINKHFTKYILRNLCRIKYLYSAD